MHQYYDKYFCKIKVLVPQLIFTFFLFRIMSRCNVYRIQLIFCRIKYFCLYRMHSFASVVLLKSVTSMSQQYLIFSCDSVRMIRETTETEPPLIGQSRYRLSLLKAGAAARWSKPELPLVGQSRSRLSLVRASTASHCSKLEPPLVGQSQSRLSLVKAGAASHWSKPEPPLIGQSQSRLSLVCAGAASEADI